MERCQEHFEKTRHGLVCGQISRKVHFSFLEHFGEKCMRETMFPLV